MKADDVFTSDIYQQYKSKNGSGFGKVFLEPFKTGFSNTGPLPMFKSSHSKQHNIRLPKALLERRKNDTQVLSLMGLLPEINRVWVSIDNCLYLWDYTSNNDFELAITMNRDDDGIGGTSGNDSVGNKNKSNGDSSINGSPSKSQKTKDTTTPGTSPSSKNSLGTSSTAIVSVALAAPKPTIFHEDVKYVLVVATTMHVAVIALKCDNNSNSNNNITSLQNVSNLQSRDRGSKIPTNNFSQSMNDYHQITYLQTDFVVSTDNILIRKVIGTQMGRIFMCGSDNNLYEMVYENSYSTWSALAGSNAPSSRSWKIKQSGWNWKLSHLMPPMMKDSFSEYMSDIVVDDVRNVLYTADSYSNLSVFYLGDNGDASIYASHSFHLFTKCFEFLSNTANGKEGSPSSAVFNEDSQARGLKIISLHVLPLIESRLCHLLVVLSNGVRVYLHLLNADGSKYIDADSKRRQESPKGNNTLSSLNGQSGQQIPLLSSVFSSNGPKDLQIAFIRAPVHGDIIKALEGGQLGQDDGYYPTVRVNDSLRVNNALYNKGVFLMATKPAGYDTTEQLLAMCDDSWARDLSTSNNRPSLRESLSVIDLEDGGDIHDMKENCSAMNYAIASQVMSLFMASFTPEDVDKFDGVPVISYNKNMEASEVPALSSVAIAANGRAASLGISRNSLDFIPIQSELAIQHMPVPTYAMQRQFLILESNQLRVMQKLRPVDYLYNAIRSNLNNLNGMQQILRHISNGYGPDQYCAMCIGIACGIPCDAGGNPGMIASVPSAAGVRDPVKEAALSCLKLRSLSTTFPSIKPSVNVDNNLDAIIRDPTKLTEDNVQLSSVFDGIQLFLSRLLRPLWLRPIVQIKNGRPQPAQYLSSELLTSIATPLHALQEVMLALFQSTILSNNRFGAGTGSVAGMGRANPQNFAAMQANQNLRKEEMGQRLAQQYEDMCICKLYRLLKRSIQSIHLVQTLLIADQEWKLPVRWADFYRNTNLHIITFRHLARSFTTHDEVKTSLRKLFLASSNQSKNIKGASSVKISQNVIDNLTNKLKTDCYMFYSEGDEMWHKAEEGLASLEDQLALSLSAVSPEIQQHAQKTIQNLVDAASHWHDLHLVLPDNDTPVTELEAKCMQLMALGKIGRKEVPTLCMTAVKNFIDSQYGVHVFNSNNFARASYGTSKDSIVDHREIDDRGLYHGGSLLTKDELEKGRLAVYTTLVDCILSLKKTHASNVAAGGGQVVKMNHKGAGLVDAHETEQIMLDLINESIRQLDTSPEQQEEFLIELCKRLYTDQGCELLLQLSNNYVQKFLHANDADLLYRWFNIHGKHNQATALMYSIATSKGDGAGGVGVGGSMRMDITTRIEYLQRAWRSASVANTTSKYDYQVALQIAEAWKMALDGYTHLLNDMENQQPINELERQNGNEHVDDYAKYIEYMKNENILEEIKFSFISEDIMQSADRGLDSSQSALRTAATSKKAKWLLSELFKFSLWEEYLSLHKAMQCNQTIQRDAPLSSDIEKLWKSIIYR
jgi:hypothetical protein